jgi:DNA-binding response OmpR family regulator
MHILVVEDEAVVADVLQRALERLGNSCIVAPSAEAASLALRQEPVDGVTLDLSLADGEGGLTWLESLAAERPELARRTIVVTGRELEADSVELVARCGAGVLAKPFTLQELGDAVRAQLEHARGGTRRD